MREAMEDSRWEELRRRAEESLRGDGGGVPEKLRRSLNDLLHELEAYREELLLRNQEFSKANRELKESRKWLETSLQEKELLLKELRHRFKNNLQTIHSLLKIQADSYEDPKLREAFLQGTHRVKAICLLHDALGESENPELVQLNSYLEAIARNFHHGFCGLQRGYVSVEVRCPSLCMESKKAVTCGLVVNELLTNSFQHAFSQDGPGRVWIGVEEKGGTVELIYEDSGTGLAHGDPSGGEGNLGLSLVKILVEGDLKGSMEMPGEEGARFRIRFNNSGPSKQENSHESGNHRQRTGRLNRRLRSGHERHRPGNRSSG